MDLDKMRQRKDESTARTERGGGSKLWKLDEGDYKVFIHPPVHPGDDFEFTAGLNFIQIMLHYGIGKPSYMCLDPELNPAILHPLIRKQVQEKKDFAITSRSKCPIDVAVAGPKTPEMEETLKAHRRSARYLFGVTPMYFRAPKQRDWKELPFEPRVYLVGPMVFEGIMQELTDSESVDFVSLSEPTLLCITRSGKEFTNTSYSVRADKDTLRKPYKFTAQQQQILKDAVKVGGACDLFRVVANWVKTPKQLEAALAGIEAEEDDATDFPPKDARPKTQEHDLEPRRPECFGKGGQKQRVCDACDYETKCLETLNSAKGSAKDDNEETQQEEERYNEPECFGDFLETDGSCKKCELQADCREATPLKAPDEDLGPEQQEEAAPEQEPPSDEEDPELKKIRSQVEKLASQRKKR